MVEGKERLVLVHPGGGNEMKSPEKNVLPLSSQILAGKLEQWDWWAQNKTDDSYESAGWLIEGRHGWWIFCPLWLLGLICFQWHLFSSTIMTLFYRPSIPSTSRLSEPCFLCANVRGAKG